MAETIAAQAIARDLFVGRTSDGARMFVTVELRERHGRVRTIDHREIDTYRELSITGSRIDKGQRDITGGGQNIGDLRDVARSPISAPVADRRDLLGLATIWQRWHLNGMRAACRHQTPVGETADERLSRTPACPDTGYRWGSAWLVEPLPAEVEAEVCRIVAALH